MNKKLKLFLDYYMELVIEEILFGAGIIKREIDYKDIRNTLQFI